MSNFSRSDQALSQLVRVCECECVCVCVCVCVFVFTVPHPANILDPVSE